MEEAISFGIWTLIPPVFIIVFALKMRKSFEALILGSVIALIMAHGWGFLTELLNIMQAQISDNAWMWLVLGLFGSFLALLTKSNGAIAFGEWLSRVCKSEKSTLFASWFMGIVLFVDDYLNVLAISTTMMPLTDKHKSPREILAYVVDSTGAPVCVLIPLSTWVVFYVSVIESQPELAELGTGMEVYIRSIPYMFYPMAAVVIVPLVIAGIIPKLGEMKKAYKRVEQGGGVYSDFSAKFNTQNEMVQADARARKGKAVNFIIPMAVLLAIGIYTQDLLPALAISIIVQIVLYLPAKVITFREISDLMVSGFASMMTMFFITLGALTVKSSMDAINLPDYVISAVLPYMTPELIPAAAFAVVAVLIFVVGSCWGLSAISIPIFIPLAITAGADVYMTLAAVISAAAFGSHACFYADATVLSSQACKIDNMEHALSQIPYAIIGGVAAVIITVIVGYVII